MPLVVSLRLNKAVMSLQSRAGTCSTGLISSSLEAEEGEKEGFTQEPEACSVGFLTILEPIQSPGKKRA